MKNLIIFSLVAVCAVLISSESAEAGGGGGKTKSRARVVMRNVEPGNGIGIAAWVRPVGTPLPRTLGQLRRQLVFMGPGEVRRTSKLKNGAYEISIVDAAATQGPSNTVLDLAAVRRMALGNTEFNINGADRSFNVAQSGLRQTN